MHRFHLEDLVRKRKDLTTGKRIFAVLAVFVLLLTTYLLILPAVSLDGETAKEDPAISMATDKDNEKETAATSEAVTTTIPAQAVPVTLSETTSPQVTTAPTGSESTANTTITTTTAALEEGQTYTYEDESISATVTLGKDSAVPADAVLVVTPITAGAETYDAAAEQAESAVHGETKELYLYDISFYTADGTYLSVENTATVTLSFPAGIATEDGNSVSVVHLEEEETLTPLITGLSQDETGALSEITFETVGFSTYAVVLIDKESTEDPELDGKTYAIVDINSDNSNSKFYAMQSTSNGNRTGSQKGLDGIEVTKTTSEDGSTIYVNCDSDLTMWTFQKIQDKTYYIYTTDDSGTKQYLNINGQDNVVISTTPQNLTVQSNLNTGTYSGYVTIQNSSGIALNWYGGGDSSRLYFSGWAYGASDHNNYLVLAEADSTVFFDLNLPTIKGSALENETTPWANGVPAITTTSVAYDQFTQLTSKPSGYTEGLGAAGELYKKKYTTVADSDNPYADLYRYNIADGYNFTTSSSTTKYLKDFGYYKEVKFEGWKYNGYLFAPDTEVTENADGTRTATAIGKYYSDGTWSDCKETVTIEKGATFTGQWTMVSSPVEFFVNYSGTILDTEGDVSGRNTAAFTDQCAIGTLLYGKQQVGTDNEFATATNEAITNMIVDAKDLDFKNTQIYLEFITTYRDSDKTVYFNDSNPGANANMLEEQLLNWIKNSSMTIQTSTGDGNAAIDNSLADSDHYRVRWYVMKDQNDGWHIDGVLVGITTDMTITKTFQGLSETQANALLTGGFTIQMSTSKDGTQSGVYLNLTSISKTGQYDYAASSYNSDTKSLTVTWSNVRVLIGQEYTMTETGYYTSTGTDNNANLKSYTSGNTTYSVYDSSIISRNSDLVQTGGSAGMLTTSTEKKYQIIGDTTKTVDFTNTYTEQKKGTLIIQKTNSETAALMAGAEFTLYKGTGTTKTEIQTVTTDANGVATFLNLSAGTYIIEETKVPDGFQKTINSIQLVVTSNSDRWNPKMVMTLYSESGETIKTNEVNGIYESAITADVENTPLNETVTIIKNFQGLTYDEISTVLTYYQIQVNTESGTAVKTLSKTNADSISSDQSTLIWYLPEQAVGKYTLTESDYMHSNYLAVTVDATQKIGSNEATTLETLDVTTEYENTGKATASVTYTKETDKDSVVTLQNSYSNTFTLQIRKTDTKTGDPLTGAKFKLYGSFAKATNTSDTITYTKEDGTTEKLYYKGSTEATDANGYTTISDLNLSSGSTTYVYVLDETSAPEGYYCPTGQSAMHYLVIHATDDNFHNGKYTLSVENTKLSDMISMPETGGMGTLPVQICGVCLSASAATLLLRKRLRRSA